MRAVPKPLLWFALLSAVVFGFYQFRSWRSQRDADKNQFVTVQADRGPITAKVTASGTLSALVTVDVGSQVSGRIREILVDYNAAVKKGQVIARLDPQLLNATQEQARANYHAAVADHKAAQAQAKNAQRQLERQRELIERKLSAQADFDTAQSDADVAQAQVASAQGKVEQTRAALHQAEVNLEYATITSPIDGVVISRSVAVGQTVAASLQTPTLFEIAEDLRKMQVDTNVAEADVGKLEPGMTATFTVDAYPDRRFEGSVRQIRNSPTTTQNVVTYDAVIDVANSELKLRPGMTANVMFVYADEPDALRIANAALRWKPSAELLAAQKQARAERRGDTAHAQAASELTSTLAPDALKSTGANVRTLWVLRDRTPTPVRVTLGITDGTHTEVRGGDLRVGDRLITDVAPTPGSSTTSSTSTGGQRSGPPRGPRFL